MPKNFPRMNSRHFPSFLVVMALMVLFPLAVQSQLPSADPSSWSILDKPGALLKADRQWTDEEGWTHYFNETHERLLVSIQRFGQELGDPGLPLSISTGLLANYGKGANDLSGADYVGQAVWLTINRYWRIENAPPLERPVRIRFYFTQQDLDDLRKGLAPLEQSLSGPEDMQFYTLQGKSVHPFSTRTEQAGIQFAVHQEAQFGQIRDLYFAEWSLADLNCSGSAGFTMPIEQEQHTVSGHITDQYGRPVEDIFIQSPVAGAVVRTTADGEFVLANLPSGAKQELQPYAESTPTAGVTVLDLIALRKYLNGEGPLPSPFHLFAADLNHSSRVEEGDLDLMFDLILGNTSDFPEQRSWTFMPADFKFADPQKPFYPNPPSKIELDHLMGDVTQQDFIAVKIGDLWEETGTKEDWDAALEPTFSLDDLSFCGGEAVVSVDLKVEDFAGIRGFQFSLNWDPAALTFLRAENFHLPDMSARNFGTRYAKDGQLTLAWYTAERPERIRLNDGETLCTLVFRTEGEHASRVIFRDQPTDIQILRDDLSPANALFRSGSIRSSGNRPLLIEQVRTKPVGCAGQNDGSIEVSAAGGRPPYSYLWNTGDQSPGLQRLGAGVYALTITDAQGCTQMASFEVKERSEVLVNRTLRPASGAHQSDGNIRINDLLGSRAPQQFVWDNGTIGPEVGQLKPGRYRTTVTDADGCRFPLEFALNAGPLPDQTQARLAQLRQPADTMTFLQIDSQTEQTLQLKISDEKGRPVYQEVVWVGPGENRKYFRTPSEPGLYLIQLLPGMGNVISLRLVVNKE